jgi:4-hydroxy-3-polyprenylbenzoate decarboxylase
MPYRNLAEFLDDLGRAGELAPVDAEVDPCLEVAEVTRRVAWQNGPALLFRNVKGHDIPLVTNLFGTESRILRALGADSIEEATERIDRALNGGGNEGWLERLRFGSKSGAAASFAANKVKAGACQQVVKIGSDINLLELPPLPRDNDERDTLAMHSASIISSEPQTHAQLFLCGNLLVTGRDSAVIAWSDLADPSRLTSAYRKLESRMPVAIIIGGDPVVSLAAAAPLPSLVDPLGLAGLLRERPLDAVACRSVDLLAPAETDIVIEGFVDPAEPPATSRPHADKGMFASRPWRVLHVTAVTHRANPVMAIVAPTSEGNEACLRDRFVARLFLPYLRQRIPELVDFDLPLSGGARHLAILSIDKTYQGQPQQVAAVAWGMRPFHFARLLVVVDADIDVRDSEQVLTAIAEEADWQHDRWELRGAADPLDPTSSWGSPSRCVAIDATRGIDSKFSNDQDSIRQLVTDRWSEYGLGPESEP